MSTQISAVTWWLICKPAPRRSWEPSHTTPSRPISQPSRSSGGTKQRWPATASDSSPNRRPPALCCIRRWWWPLTPLSVYCVVAHFLRRSVRRAEAQAWGSRPGALRRAVTEQRAATRRMIAAEQEWERHNDEWERQRHSKLGACSSAPTIEP